MTEVNSPRETKSRSNNYFDLSYIFNAQTGLFAAEVLVAGIGLYYIYQSTNKVTDDVTDAAKSEFYEHRIEVWREGNAPLLGDPVTWSEMNEACIFEVTHLDISNAEDLLYARLWLLPYVVTNPLQYNWDVRSDVMGWAVLHPSQYSQGLNPIPIMTSSLTLQYAPNFDGDQFALYGSTCVYVYNDRDGILSSLLNRSHFTDDQHAVADQWVQDFIVKYNNIISHNNKDSPAYWEAAQFIYFYPLFFRITNINKATVLVEDIYRRKRLLYGAIDAENQIKWDNAHWIVEHSIYFTQGDLDTANQLISAEAAYKQAQTQGHPCPGTAAGTGHCEEW